MKKNKFRLLVSGVCLALGCLACSRSVTVSEFIEYTEQESDFHREYSDETYQLSCDYQPAQLLALMELRGNLQSQQAVSASRWDSLTKVFSQAYYFRLRIGRKDSADILRAGVGNQQEYTQRVNELSFHLGSQVYLLAPNQDTIRPIMFDMQRSYGMSPDATFLLAFSREALSSHPRFELVYQDQHFGLSAPVNFVFDTQDLTKPLPTVTFP